MLNMVKYIRINIKGGTDSGIEPVRENDKLRAV